MSTSFAADNILSVTRSSLLIEHASTMGNDLFRVDPAWTAEEARTRMGDFDAAPVADHEGIHRFVWRHDLRDGTRVDACATPIDALRMLHGRTPLMDGLRRLRDHRAYFVLETRGVDGIFTISDLQRTAVSMAVLSTIFGVEHAFKSIVRQHEKGDDWLDAFEEASRSKIEAIYAARQRHNVEIDLLDCLTTSQKTNLMRKLGLSGELGYETRREWDEAVEPLLKLRDVLAHASTVMDACHGDPDKAVDLIVRLDDFAEVVSIFASREVIHA